MAKDTDEEIWTRYTLRSTVQAKRCACGADGLAGIIQEGMRFYACPMDDLALGKGYDIVVAVQIAEDVNAGVSIVDLVRMLKDETLDFDFGQRSREAMEGIARGLRTIADEAAKAARAIEERAPEHYSNRDIDERNEKLEREAAEPRRQA